MKKILALIILIAVGYGVWHLYIKTVRTPVPTPNFETSSTATSTTKPDLSNATFQFEDGPITLKKGTNEQEVAPGSAATQETTLTNIVGYGELNGDKKEDAAAIIVQNGAGSGIFFYVVGYISSPTTYKGTSALFLGDRISPESIDIKGEVITVTYLDRKPDEAYDAEPTVRTTKKFVYNGNDLEER